MKIFDFEVEDRLDDLKKNFEQVSEIRNSLADSRDKYRLFASEIEISKESLLACCETFERTLLINSYTFSEQLVKNFIYEIIEKDNHQNACLNMFIDKKIPKSKFSPNVMLKEIEKSISNELFNGFKFILPKTNNEIKIYNEMVSSRHTYAHNGSYNFNYNYFTSVIQVLEYISFELSMVIIYGTIYRRKFQGELNKIQEQSREIQFDSSNKNRQYRAHIRDGLKKLKTLCKKFNKKYYDDMNNIQILKNLSNQIKIVSKMDLRNISDCNNEKQKLLIMIS